MRVLFISNYRDGTGYAQAGIDYILSLDAAGVDVVCRPIRYNGFVGPIPERILQLEARPARGCDTVIQHCLPPQMEYDGRFAACIGLFAWETSRLPVGWADHLRLMDQVWVIGKEQRAACLASGLAEPSLQIVPHATDITRFQRSVGPLAELIPYQEAGELLFYCVGEWVRRKGHIDLLKAYHLEFDRDEPVRLVLKTSVPGQSPEQARATVQEFCGNVRAGLKVPGAKPEVILTERLTPEGILRLHASCDCYVTASHGEAWGYGAFDAMAMGKTPIVPAGAGFEGYLSEAEGWLVASRQEAAFGAMEAPPGLYTGRETWAAVDIGLLRRAMREAYEDSRLRQTKAEQGIERAYDFTYESIGALMKGLLDEQGTLHRL